MYSALPKHVQSRQFLPCWCTLRYPRRRGQLNFNYLFSLVVLKELLGKECIEAVQKQKKVSGTGWKKIVYRLWVTALVKFGCSYCRGFHPSARGGGRSRVFRMLFRIQALHSPTNLPLSSTPHFLLGSHLLVLMLMINFCKQRIKMFFTGLVPRTNLLPGHMGKVLV